MTDQREKMREALRQIRKTCDEPMGPSRSGLLDKIATLADTAISAGETKSDGGTDGRASEAMGLAKAALSQDLNAPSETADGAGTSRAGIKPGPSDPIPSQPDERERVKQVIELAMIEEAEIQYADFTDRDRQREKIIANAADAILAMQAERRGAKQDIVDLAKDLVALWTSPKISGLPRSERNAAIEDTRNAMIEAVSEVTGSSPVAPATNAAVAQSAEQPFCKGTVSGSSPDGGTNTQPAPIAGLEPVAWRYWWRSKYLTYSLNEPRPDDAEPLYTRAQLEAHAAEQVRAEREAWQLKLQQLYESASRKLRDTSCLMSNPPQNSAVWDIRNEIAALHARAQMERGE